jgi:GTP diphosphokinase / guanosine-3',5'-bis(diphosphate) 3'-diphosphatase
MNGKLLLEAAAFASEKHRDQRRKDTHASPYINHPIQVASLLSTGGQVEDEEVLAAALLHDTVEDTDTTFDELTERFGARVSGFVAEMTDDKALPKEERKRVQIEHAPSLSNEATLVKLCDKICNISDVTSNPPADWSIERRRKYFEWAAAVVAACPRVDTPLFSRFDELFEAGMSSLS